MWHSVGEWLQQYAVTGKGADETIWLGWDAWVSIGATGKRGAARRGSQ
jgi:hypothetical protein